MRRLLTCAVLWLALSLPSQISAATITSQPMSKGGTIIFVEGDLEYGDEKPFASIAVPLEEAVVVFKSNGGNLKAGIEIGKAIRLKGFVTYVPDGQNCASACALAWLGGRTRLMSNTARVGFHAAYTATNGEREPTAVGNALVGAYLSQLGMPEPAIVYITKAAPSDIQWLTLADAARVGIEVKTFDIAETPSRSTGARPASAPARQDWSIYGEWVQIYSRPTLVEAAQIGAETKKTISNTAVFRYANGWYGVVIGPFSAGRGSQQRNAMLAAGTIPADSLVTTGEKFVSLEFGEAPQALSARGPSSDLERRAVSFIQTFHDVWSGDNGMALARLAELYAERPVYYGKAVLRQDVLREKREFADRWPSRLYTMRPGSIVAECSPATSECTVSGIVEWRAASPARAATSEGSARYELRVVFAGSRTIIVGESGVVLSRSLSRR